MTLHPFVAAMLEQLKGRPALSSGSPEDARAMVAAARAVIGQGPAMAEVRDIQVPTRAGSIAARHFRPTDAPAGLLVYLHGGGWVVGALDDYDTLARTLAAQSGCSVLLPDYRLAPEHQFPAGLDDAVDALTHGRELAGPATPLLVAGDSAGANLAAVAARKLRGKVALAGQALIYPVADCDFGRPSYHAYGAGLPLTRDDMVWFFRHYAPEAQWTSPDIAPLRAADDLAGLPPTLVVLAECDVLADEGRAFADALERAGVPVMRRTAEGVTHGFIRLHNLFDVAAREVEAVAEFAARASRVAG
ncbi:alpha/beta hydrolase [Alsobacter metallidurans]|uniref:Alpha/beta hydrolase n=1 Tax=Alsobacter metallidurans TaxID=340221 RepID=A0A917MKK5_9HYPH|nr:alpha/beta hydrolase [Alsobacter metallidurans]GGH24332.1 alpha/beta hydrolase [Alsobacter metallidurans]